MGRSSKFLSREEHGVAAGALFYKIEGEKHLDVIQRHWGKGQGCSSLSLGQLRSGTMEQLLPLRYWPSNPVSS